MVFNLISPAHSQTDKFRRNRTNYNDGRDQKYSTARLWLRKLVLEIQQSEHAPPT